MEEQELNNEQKRGLYEFGKEYFKALLANEHPNMKIGNELSFGIRFYGEDGKPMSEIVETIDRNDL